MSDKEKHGPHGDPHHDDHDHDHKKKKKRGRGGLVLFLLILLVILLALMWFFRNGFGLGKGDGGNSDAGGSGTSSVSDTSSDFNSDITEIRVDQNDIYFGSDKCADENDLKEKITAAGEGKKYKLVHETALEETYNKVRQVLSELKDVLKLEVDFN